MMIPPAPNQPAGLIPPARRRTAALQWLLLAVAWPVALGLGIAGFWQHGLLTGQPHSPFDAVYLTIQLIILESGAVPPPIPWELQMARFLLPALTVATAVQALMTHYHQQYQLAFLRLRGGHVIICGLSRKGALIATGLRQKGQAVVIIEHNKDNPFIESCRALGALVLTGDATQPEMLEKAGVRSARSLAALSEADGVNAEIAVRTRQLNQGPRPTGLSVILHLVDPQLCRLLREREFETIPDTRLSFKLFNIYERGARILLRKYNPFTVPDPHILVVGLGKFGESLVVHASMEWRALARPRQKLTITLVDQQAKARLASLSIRYPALSKASRLQALNIDVHSAAFEKADYLRDKTGQLTVNAIYICLDNDSLGLHSGLTLLRQTRQGQIPIWVRMAELSGLASLIQPDENGYDAFEYLHPFALLHEACTPDLLQDGVQELLAQAIHDKYRLGEQQGGRFSAANPAHLAWEALAEPFKESNRRSAANLGVLLAGAGYRIGMLTDWEAEDFCFTPEEMELMACAEHERFVNERLAEGWKLGPKDPARKTNPSLVAWDSLPEELKELDREMVRGLPRFLTRVGLQVYKAAGTAVETHGEPGLAA